MDNNLEIIYHLKNFDLDSINHPLTEKLINEKFRELANVYHTDKGIHKDGKKMSEINITRNFLKSNLNLVNEYICNKQNDMLSFDLLKELFLSGKYDLFLHQALEIISKKDALKILDNDYMEVCRLLGELYEKNSRFKNYNQAFVWYKKCADLGDVVSQIKLADWYFDGEKIISDEIEMFKLYESAAKQGNPWAQFRLGWCYHSGLGTNIDYDKALDWYEIAATQGQASAMRNIGCLYKDGLIGYEENPKQAFVWLLKAAEHGNVAALCNVGWCYEYGYGTIRNPCEAFKWYELSAKKNDKFGISNLGICYMQGTGCQKNSSKAIKLLSIAAKQGNAEDWRKLASCYYKFGFNENAFYWYEKAANKGDLEAIKCVIECYQDGIGVKKDKKKAKCWQERYWDFLLGE